MGRRMCRALTKVILVLALLHSILDFVCPQKYVTRIRDVNPRSYADPTVVKPHPGTGQKYSEGSDTLPDAGVPPDAGIAPALPPESGHYDKPAKDDYTPDSVTKDTGGNAYDEDRGKNVPNDEVVCH